MSRSTNYAAFERALREKDTQEAWGQARGLPQLSLGQALRLTILLGRDGHPAFVRAARRFLVRFLGEQSPALDQVKCVADALACLRLTQNLPAIREEAERSLESLARQIES